jgi:hypothetical protein
MFVIALTQDPNTGTIGLSQPTQKCFTRIYLGGLARHALRNLVPRNQREALAVSLSQCQRGAIVEFLGEWYAWDVPIITPQPTAATAQDQNTLQQSVQSTSGAQPDPVALLERSLKVSLKVTNLHWRIIDLALSKGGLLSVRDAQRELSLANAETVRILFGEIQGLELGEVAIDRLPNGLERVLLRAYPPMG